MDECQPPDRNLIGFAEITTDEMTKVTGQHWFDITHNGKKTAEILLDLTYKPPLKSQKSDEVVDAPDQVSTTIQKKKPNQRS